MAAGSPRARGRTHRIGLAAACLCMAAASHAAGTQDPAALQAHAERFLKTQTAGLPGKVTIQVKPPRAALPAGECLADVVHRLLPYWQDVIVPELLDGRTVLVVAHGNSLRALVKELESISDEDIVGLDIPTGFPRVYELDDQLQVESRRYLGDPAAAASAAEAVARQAER